MSTIDELIVRIDADTRGLRQGLDRATDSTRRANQKMGGAFDSTNRSVERLTSSARLLGGALAAAGAGMALRNFTRLADESTLLRSRLRLVTESTEDLRRTQQQIFSLAQDTRAEFSATVNLYSRVRRAIDATVASDRELIRTTETVNKLIQISGATAAEASAGVIQFSQGLASGTLRGDELRSVLEQLPALGEAIVKGLSIVAPELNATKGNLRDLAAEGEITTERIIAALSAMSSEVDADFSQMSRTVDQSMTQLGNSILRAVGVMDDGSGASDKLAEALDGVREVVDSEDFRTGLVAIGSAIAFIATEAANAVQQLGKIASLDASFSELLRGSSIGRVATLLGVINDEIEALGDQSDYRAPASVADLAAELDKLTKASSEAVDETEELSEEDEEAAKALAKRRKAAADFVRELTNENRVLDARISLGDKAADQLEREIAQREALGPLYEDNLDALNELNAANDNLTESLERQQEAQDELEKAAKKAAREMEREIERATDSIVDALEGVLFDGEDIFDSLADLGKAAFREIAREAIIRPIVQPIVGGAAGGGSAGGITVPGFSGGTISAGGGGGGIGGILSGGGGIFDIFSGGGLAAPSGFASDFIFSGLGQSLGFSSLGAGGMGPAAPTALGSAFGRLSSPAGTIGGFAGNFLGNSIFGSDRGVGADIGGTIGAIAGSFIPIPGVGSFLGSIAGNFLGGLFGGKESPPIGHTNLGVRNGRLVVGATGADNKADGSVTQQMAAQAAQTVNQFASQLGLEVVSSRIPGFSNLTSQGAITQGENGGQYGPQSVQEFLDLFFQASGTNLRSDSAAVNRLLAGGGDMDSLATAIANINNAEDAIEALAKALNASKDPIDQIRAQFEDLRATAVQYGLDVATIDRAIQTEIDAYNEGRAQANLGIEAAILQQTGSALGAIQSFQLNRQLSGSATPLDRVAAAQSAVQASLDAVRGGDVNAVGGLLQNANTLLQVGADAFGTATPQFAALERMVDSQVANAADLVGNEQALQDRISAAIEAQTNAATTQTEITAQMRDEIEGMRSDIRSLKAALMDRAA